MTWIVDESIFSYSMYSQLINKQHYKIVGTHFIYKHIYATLLKFHKFYMHPEIGNQKNGESQGNEVLSNLSVHYLMGGFPITFISFY